MEIVKLTNQKSSYVNKWEEIKDEAEKLVEFIGTCRKGVIALHHTQVTTDNPKNFFVLTEKLPKEIHDTFESRIIINPEILSKKTPMMVREGCASFPFKSDKGKGVTRYMEIEVTYNIPSGLKKITKTLVGFAAQIFQHEYDHGQGRNIYYEN